MQPTAPLFSKAVMLCDDGLVLGDGTRLAHFARGSSRLAIDPDRVTGLIATTFRRSPSDRDLSAIEAAAMHWQRGDKALANLRLVFAKLPQLEAPADVYRLKAAELLFDAGLTADDLAKQLGAAPGAGHYDPNQPRVAPGNGRRSGRWTDDVWSRFSAWLDEEVPVYDQDTGDEVGTQSRARAIATNPLAILGVGAAIIAGGEFLAPAAVVGATAEAAAAGAAADAAVVGATAAEDAAALTPVVGADASTSSITANAARGAESEARVLQDMGLTRNTKAVVTAEGSSVPDALTENVSVEIKDSAYVSRTRQVRIQTGAAEGSGRESILVTGEQTRISRPAADAFDQIVRRPDLGPR